MDEIRLTRLEEQVKVVAQDMADVKSSLKDIAESLRILAVLEEKHNAASDSLRRAFTSIDDHEKRIDGIEQSLPNLKLASGWVFKAVIAVMGVLGAAALMVILKH